MILPGQYRTMGTAVFGGSFVPRRNTRHKATFSASGKFRLCLASSSPHKAWMLYGDPLGQAENSDSVRIPPLPIKGGALYGVPGNGKYTKYSRIFHTFAWNKISRRKSLSHYAILPKSSIIFPFSLLLFTNLPFIIKKKSPEGLPCPLDSSPDPNKLEEAPYAAS